MSRTNPLVTDQLLAAARFRKSTRSNSSSSCVEVAKNLAATDGVVLVRDTKNRDGGVLAFSPDEWTAFSGGVRDGEFDL